MAKIKQPYDEPREVPALGYQTVNPGDEVDVPDDHLASYLEAGWVPADTATKKAGERLYAEGAITVLAGVDATRLVKLRGGQGDEDANVGEG